MSDNWQFLQTLTVDASHRAAAFANDTAHAQLVMFGGESGKGAGHRNDTWVYDNGTWIKQNPRTVPPGRIAHSMVYDGARKKILLFGGVGDQGASLGDTWAWDGAEWSEERPASSPSPRQNASMVYDETRQLVVLFGGEGPTADTERISGIMNDTWLWDGTNWTQAQPLVVPPARVGASIAYDSVREVAVLFGGGSGPLLDDTWLWDGAIWAAQQPAISPTARQNAAMAFDVNQGQILLFGGTNLDPGLDDTWAWDGANWLLLEPGGHPKGTFLDVDMVYYVSGQSTLLIANPGPAIAGDGSKSMSPSELWVWEKS